MKTYTQEDVERFRRFHDVTPGETPGREVVYDWGLAGPHGAWFVLIREEHHTDEDIEEAKKYLRRMRDVVRLEVGKVRR